MTDDADGTPHQPPPTDRPERARSRKRREKKASRASAKSQERLEKKASRSSGKGLAAVMLILGLLLGTLAGGLIGVFAPRTGVLENLPQARDPNPTPVPSPVPTTVTRTVEVETFVTPEDCLAALDDLTTNSDEVAGAREALMRAEVERASGDDQAADNGFAEVDRRLRSLIIAGSTQSLRTAIENCRDRRDPGAAPPTTPTPLETAEPGSAETPAASPTPSPTTQADVGAP